VLLPTLAHWDRDSFAHQPLTETVSESQAFDGMRKIVLVESRRAHAVEASIRQILALNGGKWRERVEVYDWRVLEECGDHSLGLVGGKKYVLGATMFDESKDRAIFVENATFGRY
jgi:DNA ligase 4